MEWYPLFNTLRVALMATAAALALGIPAACLCLRLPRPGRTALDVFLCLPLVLSPTVTGWLLMMFLGSRKPLGLLFQNTFGVQLTLAWWSPIFAAFFAALPVVYTASRVGFTSFDEELADSARTLGRSSLWTFWRLQIPQCWRTLAAGTALALARAMGEYGATAMVAGYTPGRTATLSTTVYQLWRQNEEASALRWALVNIFLSILFLLALKALSGGKKGGGRQWL